MIVHINYNGTRSISLTVWIYIIPNETLRCPLLLDRESWMCFHSRYLQPQPDGRVFGEFILSHICGDARSIAAAYVCYNGAWEVAYHLVYGIGGVTLDHKSEHIPVSLVRLDGSSAPWTTIWLICFQPTTARTSLNILFPRADNRFRCWDYNSFNLMMVRAPHHYPSAVSL